MGSTTMPVDLFNPGQVFACLGLAEAADVWLGGARGGFTTVAGRDAFRLSAPRAADPATAVVSMLQGSTLRVVVQRGGAVEAPKGMACREVSPGEAFPVETAKNDVLPLEIVVEGHPPIVVDHWGDTLRDNMKFWSGMAGYPGAALFRDALERFRDRTDLERDSWFDVPAAAKSTLGFDARTTRTPIDVGSGSSPYVRTYPVVDTLAAIGLIHARPAAEKRFTYRYSVPLDDDLPMSVLRAVLGCGELPVPFRRFRMELVRPEGSYSRFITNVYEET